MLAVTWRPPLWVADPWPSDLRAGSSTSLIRKSRLSLRSQLPSETFLFGSLQPRWHLCCLCVFSPSVVSNSLRPPQTAAHQAPLSMGFSRQEYWSGLPCTSPEDISYPGIKPRSPAWQADSLPSEPPWKLLHKQRVPNGL